MKIFLVVEIRLSSGLNKSFHPSVCGLHCGRGTATELVSVLQAEMNAINDLLLIANAVVDSIRPYAIKDLLLIVVMMCICSSNFVDVHYDFDL